MEGGITGKGFKKGDPRINRKGRPRSFDALRELAQQIAHEVAKTPSGDPVIVESHKVSVAEIILRSWAQSKNPQLQRAFIEIAFGKVPDKVDLTTGGKPITFTGQVARDDATDNDTEK
jgi:hypothetical protein